MLKWNAYTLLDDDGDDDGDDDEGEEGSEGCLLDCVNDCVNIKKLTAYRDCVQFCGLRCI